MSLVKKFDVTGTVEDLPRSCGLVETTTAGHQTELVALIMQILQKFSYRQPAECGVSPTSVRLMPKQENYRPYPSRIFHALNDCDHDKRVEVCEESLQIVDLEELDVDRVLSSDEAIFTLNGFINRHNCFYWHLRIRRLQMTFT